MPKTTDEIDEILFDLEYHLASELESERAEAMSNAEARIQQLLLKARIDECYRTCDSWHGTTDKEFAKVMNDRLAELQSKDRGEENAG